MSRTPVRAKLRSFVLDLRRRRVIRVSIAYIVVGIGLAEAASMFLPALGFDGRAVDLVALLIVLGFPVALVLAWAFDVVPASKDVGPVLAQPASVGTPGLHSVEDPVEWNRVRKLFDEVLDLPVGEREVYIDRATDEDPLLAARVRSLVQAHDTEGPLDGLQQRVRDSVRSMSNLVGQTVLHYEVEERLDSGGMGVVYRARDTRLDRPVALKFLSAHLVADPEAKERFLLEARAAATVDHPNVCTVHEVGETGEGHLYISMAFCDGESLKRRMARGSVSAPEALDIVARIARGLACAAEHHIVHRDIKPGNIMLGSDGSLKIVDFGLAKIGDEQLTLTGTRMGTVAYMSPEQTRGEPVDQRADVWSLGVVLYELLSGSKPFKGGSDQATIHAILNSEPDAVDERAPGLGLGVVSLVEKAMQKDPERRYANAAAMLRDVERLLADPDSQTSVEVLPALPPEGEHRPVIVLAWAISGFEELLDRMPAEEVDQELTRLESQIRGVVEDYGGVLNEFSEDLAVCLFGVPVTHGDDAVRAARAAMELRSTWASQGPGSSLELRGAVASENVAIRAAQRGDERPYRVGGTLVRDTLLLASTGSSGDLLLAPRLARGLAPLFDTEEASPLRLSADGPDVIPLRVLGAVESSQADNSWSGSLSHLVGRDAEMATLFRGLDRAASGEGQVLGVVGDAGVGKSRLLHEFRELLAEDGIRYVQGRCREDGERTPFLSMVEAVKGVLGIGRAEPGEIGELVSQRVQAMAPEFELYTPILLRLMSVEDDGLVLSEHRFEDEARSAAAEALCSVFTSGTRGQPLVLLLEDWHWSNRGSREVLKQLAEMSSAYPLLVVVTARPHPDVPLPSPHNRLDLEPLGFDDATRLLRSVLHAGRVDDELATYVHDKSGGNPFFIEELCHSLTETQTVKVEDGEARIAEDIGELQIPDTVQAVLRTRLDRLDPEAREVLRSASVIGREFGIEILRRVVPSPNRMNGALEVLRGSGLVQRTRLLAQPQYRFKHALTLDVTYASLLKRQRRERHASVGLAIEQLHQDRIEEVVDKLALHFSEAEDWERAVEYGFWAVRRAGSMWQYSDAEEMLLRTAGWIEQWNPPEAALRSTRIRFLLAEERIHEFLGRRNAQRTKLEEVSALVGTDVSRNRAEVVTRVGQLAILENRFGDAIEALETAISVAEQSECQEELKTAKRALGFVMRKVGRHDRAIELLSDLVELSRNGPSSVGLMSELINLALAYRDVGSWDKAWALLQEAEALEVEVSVLERGYVGHMKGNLLRAMGRHEEALECLDTTTRMNHGEAMARVSPQRVGVHLLAVAATHFEMAHFDEAFEAYAEAADVVRTANYPKTLATTLMLWGDGLMSTGRAGEATQRYDEAVGLLRKLPGDPGLPAALRQLARAQEAAGVGDPQQLWRELKALGLGQDEAALALEALEQEARLEKHPDEAERLLAETATLAQEQGATLIEARARNRLANLAWRRQDLAGAAREFEQAATLLRSSDSDSLGVVLNGWGVVLSRLGDHAAARTVLLEALEVNRAAEDTARVADCMAGLGAAHRATDAIDEAADWYRQSLSARRSCGDRSGEGWALVRLAECMHGDDRSALLSEALLVAEATNDQTLLSFARGLGSPNQSIQSQTTRPSPELDDAQLHHRT